MVKAEGSSLIAPRLQCRPHRVASDSLSTIHQPITPMQDFTAGGIAATPSKKSQTTGSSRIDELVKQLVGAPG